MDERRFDTVTRGFAEIDWSRRRVARKLAGGALASLLGWNMRETTAKKRRKKKKKKPAPNCTPTCTGNKVCQPNGTCTCPPGLKECSPDGGTSGYCHECCSRGTFEPPPSGPNPDCAGNPGGQYCIRPNGFVNTCDCLSPLPENCGDGICVECCTHQKCQTKYEDEFRACIGGSCRCDEAAGFILCPDGPARNFCRHISDDANACGPTCVDCGQDDHGWQCENGVCCIGPGHACVPAQPQCCGGGQCVNTGTPQFPTYTCG